MVNGFWSGIYFAGTIRETKGFVLDDRTNHSYRQRQAGRRAVLDDLVQVSLQLGDAVYLLRRLWTLAPEKGRSNRNQ